MSLYGSAVKRPVMTTLCFVAVVILGLFSLKKLPIDLYPDIDTNTIMVITFYQGASAEDIEQNVTKPLENVLNSVEHLKHITSQSRENTSVITLEFEYGYDIDVLINYIMQNNFFCPVVNVITTLHPFHLLSSLQFLCHALGGFHLLHDSV